MIVTHPTDTARVPSRTNLTLQDFDEHADRTGADFFQLLLDYAAVTRPGTLTRRSARAQASRR